MTGSRFIFVGGKKGVYEIAVHPRREPPCPLLRSLTTATEKSFVSGEKAS